MDLLPMEQYLESGCRVQTEGHLEAELPEEPPQLWWSREGQRVGQMKEPSQNSEGT